MHISHIDIVSIPVRDQQAARAFYVDKLGFAVVRDNPMGPGRRWIELAPPGAQTSITLVSWFDDMPPGSVQGMVLSATDIEAARAELLERGVEISGVEETFWGRYAIFEDPDGNGWVLQQPASDA